MADVVVIERLRSDGTVEVYNATQDMHKAGHLAVRPGGMLVFQEFQAVSLPYNRQETPTEREQRLTREREQATLAGRFADAADVDLQRGAPTRLPGEDATPGVLPDSVPQERGEVRTEAPREVTAEDTEHEARAEQARTRARGKPKAPAAS